MRARLVLSLLALFALASPGLAQDRRGGLDRILPQISRTVPGTFYDAEGPFMTPDGRATYRIKWMTPDGRIIWLTVDAQSGQVMGGAPPGPPTANHFRNDDGRNNWRGDGGWNGDGWSGGRDRGNRGGDRWNRGGDHDDRGGRGGNWNQGGRGDDRGGDDRGGDRGGHDRRHGG